jgi:hypothetical protein
MQGEQKPLTRAVSKNWRTTQLTKIKYANVENNSIGLVQKGQEKNHGDGRQSIAVLTQKEVGIRNAVSTEITPKRLEKAIFVGGKPTQKSFAI